VSGIDFVPAGQCTSTPCRSRATVELLRQQTPNFLAPNLWPSNSPDLSPVGYEIWAVMQHRVYHRQIYSVDELKQQLILTRYQRVTDGRDVRNSVLIRFFKNRTAQKFDIRSDGFSIETTCNPPFK